MATVTYADGGLKALIARLEAAASVIVPALEAGMEEGVILVREAEAVYPEPGPYRLLGENPPPFFSEQQRRFFFAALRSGQIQVPYERTGALAESWQSSVTTGGQANYGPGGVAVHGRVWTNSPIARLVMGQGFQARMFEGVWQTAQARFQQQRSQVRAVLRDAGAQALRLLFYGR